MHTVIKFSILFHELQKYDIAGSKPAEITSIAKLSLETGQLQHLYDRNERSGCFRPICPFDNLLGWQTC